MSTRVPLVLLLALSTAGEARPPAAEPRGGTELPARFEADLVYVTPTTQDGRALRLYTDSGGGLFLHQVAVDGLGLETEPASPALSAELGARARQVRLPVFAGGKGIPAPLDGDGRLLVMPTAQSTQTLPGASAIDGMLGQAWFAGRIWTWDYPARHLRLEADGWRPSSAMARVALSFKTDAAGQRALSFPGIDITVDGRTLPMLLDTGAMTVLTPQALETLDDRLPAQRATSMVVDSVFQAWRTAHPDWRVIEGAQAGTGSAMIEVPDVDIAGVRVGPVWFTHRDDANFHAFMSNLVGRRVDGAIGGNALRHFVMTVDYPGAAAYFRCVTDCAPAPSLPAR